MNHDEYIHTRLAAHLFMAIKFHFTTTAAAAAKKGDTNKKFSFPVSTKDQIHRVCRVCVCAGVCGVPAYNYVCFV